MQYDDSCFSISLRQIGVYAVELDQSIHVRAVSSSTAKSRSAPVDAATQQPPFATTAHPRRFRGSAFSDIRSESWRGFPPPRHGTYHARSSSKVAEDHRQTCVAACPPLLRPIPVTVALLQQEDPSIYQVPE